MARRILLADDSVTAQNMGRRILTDAGYEVVTVNNGSAALKKIAENKPDLIVLDVYMPGYGGLEVCQRVKENPRDTADSSLADRRQAGTIQRGRSATRGRRRVHHQAIRSDRTAHRTDQARRQDCRSAAASKIRTLRQGAGGGGTVRYRRPIRRQGNRLEKSPHHSRAPAPSPSGKRKLRRSLPPRPLACSLALTFPPSFMLRASRSGQAGRTEPGL